MLLTFMLFLRLRGGYLSTAHEKKWAPAGAHFHARVARSHLTVALLGLVSASSPLASAHGIAFLHIGGELFLGCLVAVGAGLASRLAGRIARVVSRLRSGTAAGSCPAGAVSLGARCAAARRPTPTGGTA